MQRKPPLPIHQPKIIPIVLVVEGQCRHTGYIRSSFTDIYEVITAKDGKEGWELAQARIPNIIVSDIMMPVMDGIELCKRIKEDMRTSHIPVILLTAKDSLQDKEEGYASGADSYLTKPFSAKLLHSRINNLLETRKKIASLLALADTQPKQESAVSSLNKLDNEFLQKITQIIEENLEMEKMDIAFIADKMCMSHSTLYRKIKGLTDMSANEFIRKVKNAQGSGTADVRTIYYFRNSLYDRIQQCGLFPPMFQGRIRNVAFGLCETETVDSPADSDHCLESS